jgi:hypothetical protein
MKRSTEFEDLTKELCEKHGISYELFQEMMHEERRVQHLKRRRGITERLRQMIATSLENEQ